VNLREMCDQATAAWVRRLKFSEFSIFWSCSSEARVKERCC